MNSLIRNKLDDIVFNTPVGYSVVLEFNEYLGDCDFPRSMYGDIYCMDKLRKFIELYDRVKSGLKDIEFVEVGYGELYWSQAG